MNKWERRIKENLTIDWDDVERINKKIHPVLNVFDMTSFIGGSELPVKNKITKLSLRGRSFEISMLLWAKQVKGGNVAMHIRDLLWTKIDYLERQTDYLKKFRYLGLIREFYKNGNCGSVVFDVCVSLEEERPYLIRTFPEHWISTMDWTTENKRHGFYSMQYDDLVAPRLDATC